MSWETELVSRLRYLINDIDSTSYIWTDLQLQSFLALSTIEVQSDLKKWNIIKSYTVTLSPSGTIDPDPTEHEGQDVQNLIALKAGCVIARAELKKESRTGGIRIVDDKSTIDTTDVVTNLKEATTAFCSAYEEALKAYRMGQAFDPVAVLSPYSQYNTFRR